MPVATSYPIGPNFNLTTDLYNVSNYLSYALVNGSLGLQAYNFSLTPLEFSLSAYSYTDESGGRILTTRNVTSQDLKSDNLNITLYDANITSLTFDATGLGFDYLARSISGLFNSTSYSRPVVCAYPISGQYGQLPRYLYYFLLVFSLLFRRHIWLSTAALGVAMTYSASAALHAFALFVRFRNKIPDLFQQNPSDWGDLDLQGIFPVVFAGSIMLTPVLNWSITIRRHEARPVVVLWGLLLFAASIGCLSVLFTKSGGAPLLFPSTAICQRDLSNPFCQYEALDRYSTNAFSKTSYSSCNCFDLCGTIQTKQPFRRNSQLSAYIIGDKIQALNDGKGGKTVIGFFIANAVILAVVLVQGLFGLLEVQVSQSAVRNWIYRKLTKSHLHDRFLQKVRSGFSETSRHIVSNPTHEKQWILRSKESGRDFLKFFAKLAASFIYFFSLFLAAICVPLFISTLIINEIYVLEFPQSEEADAVGQWSTYAGAIFVFIAAIIVRYGPAFRNSVGRSWGTLILLKKKWKTPHYERNSHLYNGNDAKTGLYGVVRDEEAGSPHTSSDNLGSVKQKRIRHNVATDVNHDVARFWHECWKPVRIGLENIRHARNAIIDTKNDFIDWWRDPSAHSTWDWVIIDDESISLEMHFDELGELYQSWDTKPETLATLVGPYYRKDRTHAPRPARYKKPEPEYQTLLEAVPNPIVSTHTNFNIFATALRSLQEEIENTSPDLLPKSEKSRKLWAKRAVDLLKDHHTDHAYYVHHCTCEGKGDHKPRHLHKSPTETIHVSNPSPDPDGESLAAEPQPQPSQTQVPPARRPTHLSGTSSNSLRMSSSSPPKRVAVPNRQDTHSLGASSTTSPMDEGVHQPLMGTGTETKAPTPTAYDAGYETGRPQVPAKDGANDAVSPSAVSPPVSVFHPVLGRRGGEDQS
ncbi:MAG: hypothetical protein M1814_001182 [Vezdaea aestivalis]|nr:MAG: hypothetical protein M1814_001182 [Vezdaea aestivalis]